MPKTIKIANTDFNINFFNSYMRNIFGESFAHSSLSFEKVFSEGKELSTKLEEFASKENSAYALKLNEGSEEDVSLLNQRFREVAMMLESLGLPRTSSVNEDGEQLPCINDYLMYFQGAIRPYRNSYELKEAKGNGTLEGFPYEQETLIERTKELYKLILQKVIADKSARELKRGNNEAFAYALTTPLTIPEIIKINALVNNESGIHQGFKTSNNEINGCPFSPCPKEFVPIRMQELLYLYNTEWAKAIPPYIEGISTPKEKEAHNKAICEREARFHIEFERIHPFEDGNGRTGRIILNKNLIDNELAPILITPEMHNIYLGFIDNYDYKGFGNFIYMLSSVTLTEMISHLRRVRKIDPDELGLDEMVKPSLNKALNYPSKPKK